MKKIIIFCNSLVGLLSFRKELIEELVRNNYEVCVVAPEHEYSKDIKELKCDFVPVEMDLRGTNPIKDLKLIKDFKKIVKEQKPDLALTYTIKPNIYASIACRARHVEYINNVTGLGSVLDKNKLLQAGIYKMLKVAFKKSKCVFFQNETNMKLILEKGIVKGRHQLIPGSGVNVDKFKIQPYPKDDKVVVFNYIGRVLSEKGVDDYIAAAKEIKKKGYKTEFNIIGFIEPTEDYYVDVFKKLEKDGIIKYRGQHKDVRPYIKRAHAIIHPSKYGEGMSNVLLENASSGRPIITTNNPGCFDTVDDGKTGYIFEKGNVNDLVNKIEQFINLPHDKKEKMGILGRKKMEKEFDRKVVVEKYLEEIK